MGELIRCQIYHCDYACLHDEVAMSGGDGTDSSTRVPATMCAWAHVVMPYLCPILNGLATRGLGLSCHLPGT
jgi:hypothetical protein